MVNFYIGQVGIMLTMTAFFFRFGLTDQSYLLRRLKLDRALVVQSALDCCAVLMGCGPAVNMLAKVLQGPCPVGTTLWDSQHCNTASAGELPTEMFAMAFCGLIVFFHASSPTAVAVGCLLNIALINVSLYQVGSALWLYVNIPLTVQVLAAYEVERSTMTFFVNQKFTLATTEVNARLQVQLAARRMDGEQRSLDAKRNIVRHIAHEIRNPLNICNVGTDVVLAELRTLESSLDAGDPRLPVIGRLVETVESCQEACGVASEIVDDLLNFEKISAGMVHLERVPTAFWA